MTDDATTINKERFELGSVPKIAGLSTLRGLVLYGAVFTFAGLYLYFIVEISIAKTGVPPALDGALVSAAAALAGVLGSAFALEVGTTTDESAINHGLGQAIRTATTPRERLLAGVRQALSLDASSTTKASWPRTFGIWVYAIVGSAVAVTYVLNQSETPGTIRALAIAFSGYVIAVVTSAYKSGS
jgi:hypothetical protein